MWGPLDPIALQIKRKGSDKWRDKTRGAVWGKNLLNVADPTKVGAILRGALNLSNNGIINMGWYTTGSLTRATIFAENYEYFNSMFGL
ncbi:unnamed protein product [Leptosia nina]|uniref:Uncharacterized protein n=1 Tax=Leptosia nina TaxID=320188 RepID=A0AAV1J2U1_9NEOP